ncbi:MAG: transposase [Saprospiraceae bacterium]|nr:transposase [Saprospiraceae bacterium]
MIKTEYRQRLPHIQPVGATFFVTFRLFGSLPVIKVKDLRDKYEFDLSKARLIEDNGLRNTIIFNLRKKYLYDHDIILDSLNSGPHYLKRPEIMQIVKDELHRFNGHLYDLLAFSIMSNHVHVVIDTSIQLSEDDLINEVTENITSLDVILKRIKAPIARYCNRILNKKGQFWEKESYDIYIRNEVMLSNVISYVLENPVNAGLVQKWDEYSGNFVKMSD